MNLYYYIIINSPELSDDLDEISRKSIESFNCNGIEEFSIDEPKVDEILGERSYSGGDIPREVLDEVEKKFVNGRPGIRLYFNEKKDAQNLRDYIYTFYKINAEIQSSKVEDWNENWKKNFSPIKINDELEIVPSWDDEYKSSSRKVLKLYPGMGFGTGNHETTYLCLKLMFNCQLDQSNFSVLDFGCGSGILGLATKLFNKDAVVDLYDIDQEAIDNCLQNISYNKMDSKEFGLFLSSNKEKIEKKYDLVFANILKHVLIEEGQFILDSVKRDIIISGLLIGQEDEVINEYKNIQKSISVVEVLKKGDWCAVHMRVT